MDKDQQQQQDGASGTVPDPKKVNNPFRDDAPLQEPDAAEEAENEQKRKEALTERD